MLWKCTTLEPNVRCGFSYSPQSWVTNISKISENDFQASSLLGNRWKISTVDTQTLVCKVNNRQVARHPFVLSLQKAHYKELCLLQFKGAEVDPQLLLLSFNSAAPGKLQHQPGLQVHHKCLSAFLLSVTLPWSDFYRDAHHAQSRRMNKRLCVCVCVRAPVPSFDLRLLIEQYGKDLISGDTSCKLRKTNLI